MDPRELEEIREVLAPNWNEVRQQRALNRALAARQAARKPRRGRAWAIAGLGWATAAAVVVFAALRPGDAGPSEIAAPAAAVREGATIRFADGSRATMSPGAVAEVTLETPGRVVVTQAEGAVRYEVSPNRAREFVVEAGDVRVLVVGTEFDVRIVDDHVTVSVVHGRVRVSEGERSTEITDGESVEMRVRHVDVTEPPTEEVAPDVTEPASETDIAEEEASAPPPLDDATATALLADADRARREGRTADAIALLTTLSRRNPGHPQIGNITFTLGLLHGEAGRPAVAARLFAQYRRRFRSGTLVEDAVAEEAAARSRAGEDDRARALAVEYLERYPHGVYRPRMESLRDR